MPIQRRYLPFFVLAAVQLLLALVVPSVAPSVDRSSFGSPLPPGSSGSLGPSAPGNSGAPVDPNAPVNPNASLDPNAPPGGGGAVPGSVGSAPGQPGAAPGQAGGPGDTSHCKGAQQFGDFPDAPPCIAKFPTGSSNGGATYRGVTATQVTIVYYRVMQNPAVQNLLLAADLASTAEQEQAFLDKATKFINARYETYGRTVKIEFFQGRCDPSPPLPTCFRDDAKIIAKQFNPFAVMFANNTNVPEFHDELARAGIISFGGWHFSDGFHTALRPFTYDSFMGGDAQGRLTAEYYCKRLQGKPARYAGADYRLSTRKLAILHPDIPANVGPAQTLLAQVKKCGASNAQTVPYASDITTAQQQSTAIIAKLKREGVTSVMIFGDPIAPAFLTKTATEQAYFPENVLVGAGLIDYDLLARLYSPPQWAHAFGMSDLAEFKPLPESDAGIVWRSQGGQGTVYKTANTPWGYLSVIASGIHLAGPKLDPGMFERAVLSIDIGGWERAKDPTRYLTKFGPGDYTGISDAREAYWDATAISKVDGKRGAYVSTEGGRRFKAGGWTGGDPKVPAGFGQ